jgi:hypothetical protein
MGAVLCTMSPASASSDHQIRTITVDGQNYFVSLRVVYDGIEYLGRLRFTDATSQITYPDHGAIPGMIADEAVRKAKELSETQMEQRCYRALSEKRRFSKLRNATDEMINKIKHLNRVAIGLEKGMIDPAGGKHELDQVQGELLEIVKSLRHHAGVEDEEEGQRN